MTQYILVASDWLNFAGISEYFRNLKTQYVINKNIRNTIKELNHLTDKELHDIGISRGMIWEVANNAYGKGDL